MSNETKVLLKERMNINQFDAYRGAYIVITGWKNDTNKDGRLNNSDFKNLYVYSHRTSTITEVKNENYHIVESYYLRHVDQLIFMVTDLRREVMSKEERPEFLVIYNLSKNTLEPLIDPVILNQLQDNIDT